MVVVRLPRAFRGALFLFLLIIPVAAFEAMLVTRAPWWRLPHVALAIWSGVAAMFYIALTLSMAAGRSWVIRALAWCAALWVGITTVLAFRLQSPSLGFFAVFQTVFLGLLLAWLRREMARSFFDPHLQWYERLPKPIPGLVCSISNEGGRGPFRVSRMDEEGTFLFLAGNAAERERRELFRSGMKELSFIFRDREFRCHGIPIRILNRGLGGGFQFQNLSLDTQKNLGDFIESLRGEGYVP